MLGCQRRHITNDASRHIEKPPELTIRSSFNMTTCSIIVSYRKWRHCQCFPQDRHIGYDAVVIKYMPQHGIWHPHDAVSTKNQMAIIII